MCFFSHKWVVVHKSGLNTYLTCRKCGVRKVNQQHSAGYQPYSNHWLVTGEFSKPSKPPVKP